MTYQSYPLSWPVSWARTNYRRGSDFGRHSIAECVDEITRQLKLLGATDIVISTNLRVRQDGLPYSNQAQPSDVGVAVYFKLKKADRVLACDRWIRVEDNMWSIAKHIAALRGQQRWGVGSVEQAFAGYAALPAAGQTAGEAWWSVLGFTTGIMPNDKATAAVLINEAYRAKARTAHPDAGGNDFEMAKVNAARDEGLRVIGVKA